MMQAVGVYILMALFFAFVWAINAIFGAVAFLYILGFFVAMVLIGFIVYAIMSVGA